MNDVQWLVILLLICIAFIIIGYIDGFKAKPKDTGALALRKRAKIMFLFGVILTLICLIKLIGILFFDIDTEPMNIYDTYR